MHTAVLSLAWMQGSQKLRGRGLSIASAACPAAALASWSLVLLSPELGSAQPLLPAWQLAGQLVELLASYGEQGCTCLGRHLPGWSCCQGHGRMCLQSWGPTAQWCGCLRLLGSSGRRNAAPPALTLAAPAQQPTQVGRQGPLATATLQQQASWTGSGAPFLL